jgi:hypothetical protein
MASIAKEWLAGSQDISVVAFASYSTYHRQEFMYGDRLSSRRFPHSLQICRTITLSMIRTRFVDIFSALEKLMEERHRAISEQLKFMTAGI